MYDSDSWKERGNINHTFNRRHTMDDDSYKGSVSNLLWTLLCFGLLYALIWHVVPRGIDLEAERRWQKQLSECSLYDFCEGR